LQCLRVVGLISLDLDAVILGGAFYSALNGFDLVFVVLARVVAMVRVCNPKPRSEYGSGLVIPWPWQQTSPPFPQSLMKPAGINPGRFLLGSQLS
jgi:hypothetical protein